MNAQHTKVPSSGGIEIDLARIAFPAACAAALVVALGFVSMFCRFTLGIEHGPLNVVPLLDLDGEQTLPAWFSTILLFTCAALLGLTGALRARINAPFARHWLGLAGLFLLLSFDECASVHERLMDPVQRILGTSGMFYYAWVIPVGLAVTLLGLALFRFVMNLPRDTRRLFVLAAGCYLTGALLMELVEGLHASRHGTATLTFALMAAAEETMEIAGLLLFAFAILDHIAVATGGFSVALRPLSQAQLADITPTRPLAAASSNTQ